MKSFRVHPRIGALIILASGAATVLFIVVTHKADHRPQPASAGFAKAVTGQAERLLPIGFQPFR